MRGCRSEVHLRWELGFKIPALDYCAAHSLGPWLPYGAVMLRYLVRSLDKGNE